MATIIDQRHTATILYATAMTVDVKVPDGVFEELKKFFTPQEIVELTSAIAAYNCVTRFLIALDVGERNADWSTA